MTSKIFPLHIKKSIRGRSLTILLGIALLSSSATSCVKQKQNPGKSASTPDPSSETQEYQWNRADDLIPRAGEYTNAYMSDWSTLPTADEITSRTVPQVQPTDVLGEDSKRVWEDEDQVHIEGLHLSVRWNQNIPQKEGTTLFLIRNAKEVIIENISISYSDPDYRTWDGIRIEGADRVTVRNVRLKGPVHSFHLRIEGCKDVLVENVEIEGTDFDGDGYFRCGGGIWLNNGETGKHGKNGTGIWAEHPRIPGWQVIQNTYIHNGTETDETSRNQDAILIHSPSNGMLFNNVVRNWLRPAMDACFDIGFRRKEPEFHNRFFRVERNILENATFLKTPGASGSTGSRLLFANNIFFNVQIGDYHKEGTEIYYVNNTHVFDLESVPQKLLDLSQRGADGFSSLWNYSGPTTYENTLIYKPNGSFFMFHLNDQAAPDKYKNIHSNYNLYGIADARVTWLKTSNRKGITFLNFQDWKEATRQDSQSFYTAGDPAWFTNLADHDFRLTSEKLPGTPTDEYLDPIDKRMRVDRDFSGKIRTPENISFGAFLPL